MSDQPPSSSAGKLFCAECGAAMPVDARFCGECGAKPPAAAAGGAGAGADPTQVSGGASTWQGVAPVVERTEAIPPVPPGAGAPASGPPPGGPPVAAAGAGAPPPPGTTKGKSKGPMIAAIVIVLALLAGGAFALLGGGDDDGDDESADIEREDRDEDEDEETTTTTDAEETTTTTEAADETTTTAADAPPGELTFAQAFDDSGLLVVEVPDFWQLNGAPLPDGAANIVAAEDANAFIESSQGSGMSFTRLSENNVDPNATIDFLANASNLFNACTPEERTDYVDPVFTGRRQVFTNCDGAGITVVEIAANRNTDGASVQLRIILNPDDSFDIVDRIEATFNLTA